jgi:hypothetical protein
MDFHDENTDPFDEILRSIKASSHDSCLKKEPPSHDFHNKVNQKTDAHQAGPVEFYPSITDTFPPSVFNRAHSGVFSPNLTVSPTLLILDPRLCPAGELPLELPYIKDMKTIQLNRAITLLPYLFSHNISSHLLEV